MPSSGRTKQQQTLASFFSPKGVGGSDSKVKPNIKPKPKPRPKLEPSKPANEEADEAEDKMNERSKNIKNSLESKSSVTAEFNIKNKKHSIDDEKAPRHSKMMKTIVSTNEEQDLCDTDDDNDPPRSKEEKDGISATTNITANKRDLKSKDHSTKRKKARRVIEDDGDSSTEENPTAKTVGMDSDSEYGEDASDIDDDSLMEDTDDDEKESLQTLAQDSKNKKKGIQAKLHSKGNKCINSTLKHPSKTPNLSKVSSKKLTNEKILESDKSKWTKDSHIPYSILCSTLSDIEAITSRLEIQNHLTALFRRCLLKSPKDLITLVYLASNSVAPAYECVELGVGDAILIKAIGEASGSNPSIIKKRYEKEGDLGTVAMTAKGKQRTLGFGIKPKPLIAQDTLSVFREIATTTGALSQKWKVDKIKGLLVRAEGIEAKYIIRGLQGKLRIGLAQSTVLISLAHAITLSCTMEEDDKNIDNTNKVELSEDSLKVKNPKNSIECRLESAVNIVKKAYSEVSSFDALVDALTSYPLHMINIKCTLRPGIPVDPMLAKPTKSVQEVLKRLNGKRFTCEYKYDGERAQVHMSPDGTKVFSRSLLNTSEKYPEVPLYVKEACASSNVTSFVLDTEVVAYNRETKQFVPFQVLSTRKKTEESDDNAKVKVIVQAFDLMFLNGRSLLDLTLSERRDLLRKNFCPVEQKFQFATALDHKEDGDTTLLEEFLETAVKNQCEGLMVKTLDENASYQPSYRSLNWLKLKKDYLEGMGDSVDLVPLGAYFGRGKRAGVYGAYLLACYDLDTEEYQSVCKIGTGFSDEDLTALSKGLNTKIIPQKRSQYNVSKSLECDVWFEACQVWEVKAADLSKSSTHKGAIDKTGESGRGIGMRFPRFERLRDDKKPEQATTSDQILEMYYAQDSVIGDGYNDEGI